jgi:S-DNA-T family DNA segregation ATPase FtsK/SpoIIIE
VPFQSGYAGGWTSDEPDPRQAKVAELRFGATVVWEADAGAESDEHDGDLGPNDQKRMVRNLIAAASADRHPAAAPPWLDDLAPTRRPARAARSAATRASRSASPTCPSGSCRRPCASSPTPTAHARVRHERRRQDDRAPRSIAIAAGARPDLGRAIVYGADFGTGSLRARSSRCRMSDPSSRATTPSACSACSARIRTTLDDRAKRFSDVNAATLTSTAASPARDEPRSSCSSTASARSSRSGRPRRPCAPFYAIFMRLLGEGRPLGVHAVATADRSGAVPTA